jgi:flagellar FliJ protein
MAAKTKGLRSLIRLAEADLDDKRRVLVEIEQQEATLQARTVALEAEKEQEQRHARELEFGAFAYAGYARGVIQRRERLAAQIAGLQPQLEEARQAVSEAFQTLKRYETALAARIKADKDAAERKDQQNMDEISLNAHRRRQLAEAPPAAPSPAAPSSVSRQSRA